MFCRVTASTSSLDKASQSCPAFAPFQESLVVMNEVNSALLKMFASNAIAPAGKSESPGAGRVGRGSSSEALGAVDEENESRSEVR